MNRPMQDGTAESVSRGQILRREQGQGNIHFPCLADHEKDWQPYPVDPYSPTCDDQTYKHINTHASSSCITHAHSVVSIVGVGKEQADNNWSR